MKIALVNLCSADSLKLPPLGLMYLSAALKESGNYEIAAYDLLIDHTDTTAIGNSAMSILESTPTIVCLTLYTEYAIYAALLVEKLKELSQNSVQIIVGGPHATCAPLSCVSMMKPAVVVRGPGEGVIHTIIQDIVSGKAPTAIESSLYQECTIIDARKSGLRAMQNSARVPDRKCLNPSDYRFPFSIITARGCPGKCTFCASPVIHNNEYYPRSIEEVKKELHGLYSDYNAQVIFVLDDTFTHEFHRTRDFCKSLASMDYKWFCESRIDSVDEARLHLMAESGCKEIQFGVECFDEELVRRIGKGIPISSVNKTVELASKLGIHVIVSLMIGLPGDTTSLINKRINRSLELADCGANIIEFGCLRPFPGTSIYNNAEKLGYQDCRNWWEQERDEPLCFPTTTMSREELLGMLMYANYKIQYDSSATSITPIKMSLNERESP